MNRQLPDDTDLGFSYGAYISFLRKAGSYHWYSAAATVAQLGDYVWNLMDLTSDGISFDWPMSHTNPEAVSFAGVQSASDVSIVTCFWSTDAGADMISGARRSENGTGCVRR